MEAIDRISQLEEFARLSRDDCHKICLFISFSSFLLIFAFCIDSSIQQFSVGIHSKLSFVLFPIYSTDHDLSGISISIFFELTLHTDCWFLSA